MAPIFRKMRFVLMVLLLPVGVQGTAKKFGLEIVRYLVGNDVAEKSF